MNETEAFGALMDAKLINDPREKPDVVRPLRRQIHDLARIGRRFDEKWDLSCIVTSGLARRAFDMGAREGWNGEDTMTYLAYYALLQLETTSDLLLQNAMLSTRSPLLLSTAEVAK